MHSQILGTGHSPARRARPKRVSGPPGYHLYIACIPSLRYLASSRKSGAAVDYGGWVGVALDDQIDVGTSQAVKVQNASLVLWRSAERTSVWENRCPHRGMPLSFGFVDGPMVRCLYHGWAFDGSGQCRNIPAHPDLTPPPTIRTRKFGVEVRYGIIWADVGANGPPDLPDLGPNNGWQGVRSTVFDLPTDALPRMLSAGFDAEIRWVTASAGVVERPHGASLALAVHPISQDRTAVHLSVRASERVATSERHELARGLEALRNASMKPEVADVRHA